MNVASKFESHTVPYICRNTFQNWTFLVRSHSSRFSVNMWTLRKMPLFHDFQKKKQKLFRGLWQDISCIEFLVVSDFNALIK